MKKDKEKQQKIRENNRRDFGLLFDVLTSGGTYSDYRQEMQDRSMPQERPQTITQDDILSAWILGKDMQDEQYAQGGHMHGYGDIAQTVVDIGGKIIPWISIGDSAGKFIHDNATNSNDPYSKAIYGDQDSNGFLSKIIGQKSELDNTLDYINNYNNTYSIGDTNSLYNQILSSQNLEKSTSDAKAGSRVANAIAHIPYTPDPLLNVVIGYTTDFGLPKLFGYDPVKSQNEINQAVQNQWSRDLANQNTAIFNSNQLKLFSQSQQPYMASCGGKMKHIHDNGGYINSHYDYITDPLVKVDAGGTHQENPNEGVQTSMAPDGQPNLVEEGETIINNGNEDAYVFSDRIVADADILKSHLLPEKLAGKTFADISKELEKIIQEHKTDDASQRTFDAMIKRLQEAQEDQKFKEEQAEVEKFLDGLTDEQKDQLAETMAEEAQAEAEQQAAMEQQAQEQAIAEQQAAQEQQIPPEEQQIAEQQMTAQQEQQVSSRYDQMMSRAQITDAANGGLFYKGGHIKQGLEDSYIYNAWKQNQQGLLPTEPIYDNEGNITGYKRPDIVYSELPENTAQLNPDNRNAWQRLGSKWTTYWNNIQSPEFAWAVNNLTPVSLADAVLTGDTDKIIAGASFIRTNPSQGRNFYKGQKGSKVMNSAKKSVNKSNVTYHNNEAQEAQRELDRLNAAIKNNSLPNDLTYTRGSSVPQPTNLPYLFGNYEKAVNAANFVKKALPTVPGGALLVYGLSNADKWSNYQPDPLKWDNDTTYYPVDTTGNVIYRDIDEVQNNDKNWKTPSRIDTIIPPDTNTYLSDTLTKRYIDTIPGTSIPLSDTTSYAPLSTTQTQTVTEQPQQTDTQKTNSTSTTNKQTNNTGTAPAKKKNNKSGTTNSTSVDNRKTSNATSQPGQQNTSATESQHSQAQNTENQNAQPTMRTNYFNNSYSNNPGLLNGMTFGQAQNWINDRSSSNNPGSGNGIDERGNLDTWMRYAPAFGSAAQYLSDLFGLTNKNDYTNLDMLQRKIDSIPNVSYTPIGGYRTYTPVDETYQQNLLRSQQNAMRRAALENSNGNIGAALASLDAMNSRFNDTLGNLAVQSMEYNDKQRLEVDKYNQEIARINASLSMTAQEKNQAIAAQKAALYERLAKARQDLEDANEQAKSMNQSEFYKNVGEIGRENFIMNQINSNEGLYYYVDGNGIAHYKSAYYSADEKTRKQVDDELDKRNMTINRTTNNDMLLNIRRPLFASYNYLLNHNIGEN